MLREAAYHVAPPERRQQTYDGLAHRRVPLDAVSPASRHHERLLGALHLERAQPSFRKRGRLRRGGLQRAQVERARRPESQFVEGALQRRGRVVVLRIHLAREAGRYRGWSTFESTRPSSGSVGVMSRAAASVGATSTVRMGASYRPGMNMGPMNSTGVSAS